jgi:hypothetical protein
VSATSRIVVRPSADRPSLGTADAFALNLSSACPAVLLLVGLFAGAALGSWWLVVVLMSLLGLLSCGWSAGAALLAATYPRASAVQAVMTELISVPVASTVGLATRAGGAVLGVGASAALVSRVAFFGGSAAGGSPPSWLAGAWGVVVVGVGIAIYACVLSALGVRGHIAVQRMLLAVSSVAWLWCVVMLASGRHTWSGAPIDSHASLQMAPGEPALSTTCAWLVVVALAVAPLLCGGISCQLVLNVRERVPVRTYVGILVGAQFLALALPCVLLAVALWRLGTGGVGALANAILGACVQGQAPLITDAWVAVPLAVLLVCWLLLWSSTLVLGASLAVTGVAGAGWLPRWAGPVARRSGPSPLSVAVVGLLSSGAVLLGAARGPWETLLSSGALEGLAAAGTGACAILLPFLARETFRESPVARFDLRGAPAVTILSGCAIPLVAAVMTGYAAYAAQAPSVWVSTAPLFGAWICSASAVAAYFGMQRRAATRYGSIIEFVVEPAERRVRVESRRI